jgi:shikimate 5-dehydrogenase
MSLILNRRGFLIAGGLTALASTKAFGANERLRVGVIGAGGRMKSVLGSADQSGVPFEIVSVCDVYAPRRAEIKARGNAATATEHVDYHEVLDDKTIDAVFIATPDHWHVRIATAALAAGKTPTPLSRPAWLRHAQGISATMPFTTAARRSGR